MDKIEIPDDEIVPLDEVAAGLFGLRTLFVNVFAVASDTGWVLVDAGLNGSAGPIKRWAAAHFNNVPATAIFLTHAHFDHVGALDELVEFWRAPVYVHQDEIPYVTGERAYPKPDPSVGGGMMARMAGLYPRGPINIRKVVRELPPGGLIPHLPDWQWIHTPGHTPGHVSYFRPADRALIVGDAFCTTKQESFFAVATQRPELHGPPAYFTTDWNAARDSVRTLAALRPMSVAPGHGQPIAGDETPDTLAELAERFESVAVPEDGKYVRNPVS